MLPTLGIIAGSGDLPVEIASIYSSKKGKCCIAALNGEANLALISHYLYKPFAIGEVGKIINYFSENQVQNVILIGGIKRPDFGSIKVDFTGSVLLARILKNKLLGDDKALRIIADFLEEKGFKVISPQKVLELNKDNTPFLSNKKPNKQDKIDIDIGIKLIKSLSKMDVGQSVIVADSYILGIEAAEGTDNLIRRCQLLRKKIQGGILVKMIKTTQDTRLDIPTIGPDTIYFLYKHGYNGLAIEKNNVFIVNPKEVKQLLDKYEMFIVFI